MRNLLLFSLIAAGALAQDAKIRVDVRLVNLSVRVTDKLGRPVPGLRQGDFQVLEEGVRQTVSHFQPVTAPIHLLLLLDLSGSTQAKMDVILEAAAGFVSALGPEDTVAVATFARQLHMVSEFTQDRGVLKKRIRSLENRGTRTSLYDAMWEAMDLFDRVEAMRKVIVVMTDGFDSSLLESGESSTRRGFQDVLARAGEGDAVIYPVYLNTERDFPLPGSKTLHQAYERAFKQIEALADQTGGTLFRSKKPEDLEKAYTRVAAELRTSYSLAYAPSRMPRDGTWRKIVVQVDRRGTKARTRPGYYAK